MHRQPQDPKVAALQAQLNSIQLTWDDLVSFESALLQLLPDERLKRKAWNLRNEYRDVAGEAAWERYQNSHPPDPEKATPDELRADLEELLGELHWCYTSEPVQEAQRARLLFMVLAGLMCVVGVVGAALLVWLVGIWWDGTTVERRTPVLVPAILAGALGASFSSLLRLQRTPLSGNAVVNLWKLNLMGVSAILAPFVGALSATLLIFLFAGNLVSGSFFPTLEIKSAGESCNTNQLVVAAAAQPKPVGVQGGPAEPVKEKTEPPKDERKEGQPAANSSAARTTLWPYQICLLTAGSLAKLLVWAFIAGFSERLVPDIIDRLGEKAKG